MPDWKTIEILQNHAEEINNIKAILAQLITEKNNEKEKKKEQKTNIKLEKD